MNSNPQCSQKDMFAPPPAMQGPLVLVLKGIEVPPNKSRKDKVRTTTRKLEKNCHVPSFKNSKMLMTKLPNGQPLKRPFLITSPEFQKWMNKAVQSLESQLLSLCQTESGEIQQVRSKLFAMLSRLPEDDSVNDLREGAWKVVRVPPGEEGAIITIERL